MKKFLAGTAVAALAVTGAAVAGTHLAFAATSGCRVDYTVTDQWQGGFGANVTVTDLGHAVTSWRLTWNFAGGQTISQAWAATVTQSATAVTAVNASYNGAVASGGSVSFGFNGAWTGSNPVPAGFALNGTACTGGTTTAAPPTPPPRTRSAPAPRA